MPTPNPTRLLRRPEVQARVGLSRSSIYALLAQGRFPMPVRLSDRAIAWRESDIEVWIASRPSVRTGELALDRGGEIAP